MAAYGANLGEEGKSSVQEDLHLTCLVDWI